MASHPNDNPDADDEKDAAEPLAFPSLDDSPLWQADAAPPAPPVANEAPPLDIVRERFPRIAKAIELMWGTRELESYLGKLIITERENREGFPPDVLAALLRISRQHAQQFVFEDDTTGSDPFHQHAFRKR